MDKNKMILMLGTALIVIALALSTTSVIMISKVLKNVNSGTATGEAATEAVEKVPIAETKPFELTDPMVGTLKSTEDPDRRLNVSIKIGFRLKEGKKTEALIELMTENQGVIRDRIAKLLKTKTMEEYQAEGFTEKFQMEILEIISHEFETKLIVEVFSDSLESAK